MKNEITERDKNIIARAEDVANWMKKYGWDKARKCPDRIASYLGGFDNLLMELINAVDLEP